MKTNTDTWGGAGDGMDSTGTSWGGSADTTGTAGWQSDGTLPDVACGVVSCKYHSGGSHCSAKGISVQNESAHQKAETFCSTFVSKGI